MGDSAGAGRWALGAGRWESEAGCRVPVVGAQQGSSVYPDGAAPSRSRAICVHIVS